MLSHLSESGAILSLRNNWPTWIPQGGLGLGSFTWLLISLQNHSLPPIFVWRAEYFSRVYFLHLKAIVREIGAKFLWDLHILLPSHSVPLKFHSLQVWPLCHVGDVRSSGCCLVSLLQVLQGQSLPRHDLRIDFSSEKNGLQELFLMSSLNCFPLSSSNCPCPLQPNASLPNPTPPTPFSQQVKFFQPTEAITSSLVFSHVLRPFGKQNIL